MSSVSSTHSNLELELASELFEEAERVQRDEPVLANLLNCTVLAPETRTSLAEAVAHTVAYRLLLKSNDNTPTFCPQRLQCILMEALESDILEYGHSMMEAMMEDIRAVVRRDPAMDTPLQVVLFSKGFCALVCHRAAHRLLVGTQPKEYTALYLQSQCSAVFGVDIHPRAKIGKGVMFDHATGLVIGETAIVGDGCTILHGVTLGGTGKDHGDRHPKIGDSVLIGAGSSILGNVRIGNNSKIGAGSLVLREIPPYCTAVGAPAKIVGRVAWNERPGSDVDETLEHVQTLHKGTDSSISTDETTSLSTENSSQLPDPVCPWRDVFALGREAPAGTMTICRLKDWLTPLGCTTSEVGCCFFALDVKMVGFVTLETLEKYGLEALVQHTSLSSSEASDLMAKIQSVMSGKELH